MADILLLLLGISFILSSIGYLALSKRQRDLIVSRFHFRGRRASTSKTPPRSLSPERKAPNNVPPAVDYIDIFPPSCREALVKVAESLPAERQQKIGGLEINEDEFRKSNIPLNAHYETCGPSTYTPTGFSIEEVKALGDFPDYAELSGVPLPEPYHECEVEKALPRPYRPFRWAYHQTMCACPLTGYQSSGQVADTYLALTKMESDWWLELERDYISRITERKSLFEKHGRLVLDYLPGSELGCKELMEMVLQFYCARYPRYFSLSSDKKTFHNGIMKTETNLKSLHPLHVLLRNVPEDFAIMLRNSEDGYYYFRAGVICSSLGWNLGTKLGLQLKEIHAPIPDYKEKMEFSMDRYEEALSAELTSL